MPKPSHNQAMLYLLMQHANERVPMPEVMNYTSEHCSSFCAAVHSRASDLRNKYGYDIINSTTQYKGRQYSCYQLHIGRKELEVLKRSFGPGQDIPHFNQIKKEATKSKPVQVDMFAATMRATA